jgi:hypothetical protein
MTVKITNVILIVGALLVGSSIAINRASQSGRIDGCKTVFQSIIPEQFQPSCEFKGEELVGSVIIPLQGKVLLDLRTGLPIQ